VTVRPDDEIASQLEHVLTDATDALAPGDQPQVSPPDAQIEPDPMAGDPFQPPGAIRDPIAIDQHRETNVQVVKQQAPDDLRPIVDDEHDLASERLDLRLSFQHLHEVRAADQSASVTQEADQHRASTQIGQPHHAPVEIRKDKRRGWATEAGSSGFTHAVDDAGARVQSASVPPTPACH